MQRSALTRERVIDAAIQAADEHGLESLSMRSLAKELGCGVMSLYNHVQDKDDLLDAMVDAVASEIKISKNRKSWQEDLSRCITSAYRMMLKHPWLPQQWGRSLGFSKNRYHNAILQIMCEADFPEELACRGFHALTMHVVGYSLQAMEMPFKTKQEFVAFGKQHLKSLEEQELSYLRDHVQFHLDGKDKRSDFKYMLDLILAGLESDLQRV